MRISVVAAATLALVLAASPASAGYFWWGGFSAWNSTEKSDVNIYWSHTDSTDPSLYKKWKFCWRRKSNTNEGKNPCEYNTQIVTEPQIVLTLPWDTVYKFQVEAYNLKREKWQTKSSTIVRPCFNARWSNDNVSMLCNP